MPRILLLKYLLFCKRRNIKRNEEKQGTFGEFFGKLLHRRSPVFYRAYCKRRCLVCDFAGGATTMTSGRASSPLDRVLHLSSRAIKRSKGEKSKCEHYVCGKREAQVGYNAAFRCQCAVRPSMPNTTRACINLYPHRVCEIIETQNLANPMFVRGECVALYITYTLDYTSIYTLIDTSFILAYKYSSGICLLEDQANRRASSTR